MKRQTFNKIAQMQWKINTDLVMPRSDRVFIDDACEILGLSPRTIWSWRAKGLMPPADILGNSLVWLRSDIEALRDVVLANGEVTSNA